MAGSVKATQVEFPWRTTVRTIIQAVIALAAAAPLLVAASGLDGGAAGVAVFVSVSAAVTRVMALPVVDDFLDRFGLSAHPG